MYGSMDMLGQYEYTIFSILFIFMNFPCISGRRCVDIEPSARVLAASKRKFEQSCFHLISISPSALYTFSLNHPFLNLYQLIALHCLPRLQCGEHPLPIRSPNPRSLRLILSTSTSSRHDYLVGADDPSHSLRRGSLSAKSPETSSADLQCQRPSVQGVPSSAAGGVRAEQGESRQQRNCH